MKDLRVTFKNIKTFEGHEGYGLNAKMYINGYYCMFVLDDGNGGCMDYTIQNYSKNTVMNDRVNSLVDALYKHIDSIGK